MRNINKIILHHSMSSFGCVDIIRKWHLERGWRDCGYNFVICNGVLVFNDIYRNFADGLIQIGRHIDDIPAHCRGQNSQSIGICLIGTDNFTEPQFKSCASLCFLLTRDYPQIKEIVGHNAYNQTLCPVFNVNKFLAQYCLNNYIK